ncbi:hypothetical protein V6N13_074133 [Hibiscus sabdariffa]
MPDAPQPPAPAFNTSFPLRRLKRKANRNISVADLAAKDDDASDEEEANGSSTTPEETPMTRPPQSKARYKRVASNQTPNIGTLEDKWRKRTRWCIPQLYTWAPEPTVSSHEGTPMVADSLQHSWAQNRKTAEKTKEEDILLPTWHSSAAAAPHVKGIFPYSLRAQNLRTPL